MSASVSEDALSGASNGVSGRRAAPHFRVDSAHRSPAAESATAAGDRRPPKWKAAVVTWLGVNVAALLLTVTLKPLLAHWPWALSFLTYNAVIVALLVWVVMPPLHAYFRDWMTSPR